jgi:hypothetical protein
MRIRTLAATLAVAAGFATNANAQIEIQWWHSMGGALGEALNDLANKFNASQKDYKVVPVFKGTYPVSMTAAIAAFRAGNAPHILQVFEVGTATMMAAKGAIVPVAKVMADAKEPFDPNAYLPTVAGYYTDLKGNMLSFPFNSSTVMFYVNKDAFKKAGLDPEKAPKTWKEVIAAGEKLKAAGQGCVYTTSWPSWMHIENFSAWHNADRHQAERHGRVRYRVHGEFAAARAPRCDAGRHGQEGNVHLCRPHQPGRRQVLERRMRDVQRQRGRSGGHQEGGQVRLVDQLHPVPRRREGRAAEFDHRRGVAVGDGRQEAGRVQGGGEILRLPVAA